MVSRDRLMCLFCAALAVFGRIGYFIDAPLWLDYFSGNITNSSDIPNNTVSFRAIDPCFLLFSQYAFGVVFFGLVTLFYVLFWPSKISYVEESFPKSQFAIIGISQGISSVFFNYSVSGSRTAPYLQALLANFNIPIQFTVRFLVLRKRPSFLKLCCAVAVAVAEFVCLIPTIFPQLESSKAHHDEGGATGAGRILYPLCMVTSMVPFALANSIMERSVQGKRQTISGDATRLNIMYFLFWMNLFGLITVSLLWFVDLIPGFGTAENIHDFGETFWFNIQCLFGKAGCMDAVVLLGWANLALCVVNGLAFTSLMRYSEGANFVIIVLTLRTPLLFLFWTLFEEHPFQWHPEAHLSTWLSIASICIMLPAIIVYDRAPPEKVFPRAQTLLDDQDDEYGRPLIADRDQIRSVNYVDDVGFEPDLDT